MRLPEGGRHLSGSAGARGGHGSGIFPSPAELVPGRLQGAGLPTARTAYTHLDADSDIVKTVLYLSDVAPHNGPFRFIPGSHRWKRSPMAIAVQNGFDQLWPKYLERTGKYYRPRFRTARNRQDMLSLPREFWGTTHFGDDLLDGGEMSRELLEKEVAYTGPKGTMVLFDGSHGIHRGGLVQEGGRWVVQIILKAERANAKPPGASRHPNFAYVKHCLGNLARLAHLRSA